jgi:signal transduction histidine kinase
VGFGLIAAFVIAGGLVTHLVSANVEGRARRLDRDSTDSVEALSRVTRALGHQRILVDDHIFEERAPQMAQIERQIGAENDEMEDAIRDYEPFAAQLGEATEWKYARACIERFRVSVAEALALSRKNLNHEAQQRWKRARLEADELDRVIDDLITINRRGAHDAMTRAGDAERSAVRMADLVRAVVLGLVVALGWWSVRRVAGFEEVTRLAQRNRDLEAFAGRVAHDLNNALGTIALSPGLLRDAASDPDRVRSLADRTERCSERAARVISALFAFSRASQAVNVDESTVVMDVLRDVLDELAPVATRVQARVSLDETADVAVRCEPGLLHVVLANLVGNALKFLEGQPTRSVVVSVRREGDCARFEIADTGCGIPSALHQKIFEPFFRAGGTHVGGTGLGLATVRRIVEARGGRIAVESEAGRGARFRVWLPVASARGHGPESIYR